MDKRQGEKQNIQLKTPDGPWLFFLLNIFWNVKGYIIDIWIYKLSLTKRYRIIATVQQDALSIKLNKKLS